MKHIIFYLIGFCISSITWSAGPVDTRLGALKAVLEEMDRRKLVLPKEPAVIVIGDGQVWGETPEAKVEWLITFYFDDYKQRNIFYAANMDKVTGVIRFSDLSNLQFNTPPNRGVTAKP